MRIAMDLLERRRNLVRTLHYQGLQEVDIIQKLDAAGFFPETEYWKIKRDVVRRDIEKITLADAHRFHVLEVDAHRAHYDYITRQEAIYQKAMERNDLEVAARASKDIAKAHGVQTDEPNRPKEDLMTIMMQMKQKKQLTAPPQALEGKGEEAIPSFVPANEHVS